MPGLEDWLLMNREMEAIKSVSDIPLKNTNLFNKHLFAPSMENKEKLNLKRWYVMCVCFVFNYSYSMLSKGSSNLVSWSSIWGH